jgi:molecular chaperone GrpE (heat shock protein)
MTLVSADESRFELMEQVAELTLHGHSATAISKQLNIPRKEVRTLQEDYRIALSQDGEARDLARDHLNLMVKHFDELINRLYKLIDDIDTLDWNAAAAAQKNAAIKGIAELTAKRVDALQKAGLFESAEIGDEIARWEEEKEILLSILQDICPSCQSVVGARITKLRGGEVPAIDVEVIS